MATRDELIDQRAELQKKYLNACDAERSAEPGDPRNEQTRIKIDALNKIRDITHTLRLEEQQATLERRDVSTALGAVTRSSAAGQPTKAKP
jgi:hypothetical protein